ncbi:MAG: hypothetical protein ACXWLG_01860 [Myxococcaceae bacterium]
MNSTGRFPMLDLMHERTMDRVAPLTRTARVPLDFRLLHIAGFALTLPVFALARLIPGRRGQRRDENVFAETNRSVLTALGIAFMA